ncbi:diacylglycerol diphosphate phosphatase / phosphatidate phosphatase [Entomortierella parvispora]|uniref:Diacylglycerol diphosphate phosphatase / phosphatidate phosphatase n=1 Tax=Entomortierella parvispora TaxID=205924 RepID=A0A9P3H057_9FUNG|nr:diacylglycerol diphosphate phosphatase / phosphatidate phosphatase [Entomortierella parvispora]
MFVRIQSRTKALFVSYGKDWGLVIVVLAAFTYIDSLEPFHRQFSVKDVTIQHPFAKKETVPIWLALVLAFILPGIIVGCISILQRRSYTDLHNGLLGLFLAQALVLIVTDSIKIAVGRPRPDFLDRCLSLYDNDASGHEVPLLSDPINMLSNSTICTRTTLLKDGFKSFPSGHSSFSFGGLGYLSMYLAGKLHLFDERGHIYKSVVVLAPLILAALIAASRVADYRHHWQDVSVGSIIGMIFAVFAYRQYYPSLAASNSDCPFAPRVIEKLLPTSMLPHHHHHHQPIPGEEDNVHPDDEVHHESFLSNSHHDANGNINNSSSTNVGSALGGARPFLRTGTSDSDNTPATSLVDMNGANAKYNSNNNIYDQGRR